MTGFARLRPVRDGLDIGRRAIGAKVVISSYQCVESEAWPLMDDGAIPVIKRARRSSLPEEISRQLLELIASGSFPDNRLPAERVLCAGLGVSRGPLREAFSGLQHLGVLETRGNARYGRPERARAELTRLPTMDADEVLMTHPLEARRLLEPEVAALAAARATPAALEEIDHWLVALEHAPDRNTALEQDSAFHVAIARATGNQALVGLIQALTDSLRESRALSMQPDEGPRSSSRAHRTIYDALAARDPDKARFAMRLHLDEVERLIHEALHAADDSVDSQHKQTD